MLNALKKKFVLIFFLGLTHAALASVPTAPVIISGLQATTTADSVNLKFKLSEHVNYKGSLLSNPPRFIIDFENAELNTVLNQPALSHSFLRSIHSIRIQSEQDSDPIRLRHPATNAGQALPLRGGKLKPGLYKQNLRLVFELKETSKIKMTQLKSLSKKTKQQHELLLEFIKKSSASAELAKTDTIHTIINKKNALPSENTNKKLEEELESTMAKVSTPKKDTRDIVIAIDPGHGGEDPGAIGQGRTQEKNVVLSISCELQTLINNEPGFHAILTRQGDYFIPLRKRLAIARKYKADMLIAVHADAYMNNEARGASVYSLSNRGATSEAARWLAEKENHSELLDGAKLIDDQSMLRSVLLNLQQTATTGASLQLGSCILDYLGRCSKLHHQRVEQAAFVVLKSPDISSLLVETGFISNKAEEALLTKPSYQHQLAEAITEGIKDYYHLKPPGGTFLAALMGRS